MDSIGNQTIVVGIDGSAPSDAALVWAVDEASRRGLRLHLFSAGTVKTHGGEFVHFLGDGTFLSRETNLAVPMQNRHPQGFPNGSQMLVPRPEQRKDPLRVVQHDRCFCHSAAGGSLPPDLLP